MGQITASRPSPAIIVSALALVAALAGTALGGPDASTSAVTKKKVKKIAKKQAIKQINALAPGLSVASADTADTANRANTANTANRATQAQNATTVNGLSVQKIFFKGSPNETFANRFAAGGLVLRLGCASGDPVAGVFTTRTDISLQGDVSGLNDDDGATYTNSSGLSEGFEQDITGGSTSGSGRLTYSTSTGTVLTMLYGFDNSPTFDGEDVCTFRGTVIVG
jgi:hypothetical protein